MINLPESCRPSVEASSQWKIDFRFVANHSELVLSQKKWKRFSFPFLCFSFKSDSLKVLPKRLHIFCKNTVKSGSFASYSYNLLWICRICQISNTRLVDIFLNSVKSKSSLFALIFLHFWHFFHCIFLENRPKQGQIFPLAKQKFSSSLYFNLWLRLKLIVKSFVDFFLRSYVWELTNFSSKITSRLKKTKFIWPIRKVRKHQWTTVSRPWKRLWIFEF